MSKPKAPPKAEPSLAPSPEEPKLTAVPPEYRLLPIGGKLLPARLIVAPTAGAEDASPQRPYLRELSRDGQTPALCDSEAEALLVIQIHLRLLEERRHQEARLAKAEAKTEATPPREELSKTEEAPRRKGSQTSKASPKKPTADVGLSSVQMRTLPEGSLWTAPAAPTSRPKAAPKGKGEKKGSAA